MKKILLFVVAMFIAVGAQAQDEKPMKIITNYPDFKVKVKRCAASDKTVIIDLLFSNVSSSDVEMSVYGGSSSVAYDDEGNMYKDSGLEAMVANTGDWSRYNGNGRFTLPADVPVKVSIKLEGVPSSAESIPRLMVTVDCSKWGLDRQKQLKITNIPISRD